MLNAVEAMRDAGWGRVAHNDSAGWTARDVLTHVAGAEPSMMALITQARAEGRYIPRPDFDLDFWNRRQVEKRAGKSPSDLAELESSRAAMLKWLDDLPESMLDLPVRHPAYGDMTVEDVFRVIGFHERLHADEIRAGARR